jgi:hypothetical protein
MQHLKAILKMKYGRDGEAIAAMLKYGSIHYFYDSAKNLGMYKAHMQEAWELAETRAAEGGQSVVQWLADNQQDPNSIRSHADLMITNAFNYYIGEIRAEIVDSEIDEAMALADAGKFIDKEFTVVNCLVMKEANEQGEEEVTGWEIQVLSDDGEWEVFDTWYFFDREEL